MDVKQIRKIKRKSAKQEKRTAKEFSGSTTPASGAKDYAKGDVVTGRRKAGFHTDDFLIENKYTDKEYYVLEYATWDKICKEALKASMRTPIMQIDIKDSSVVVMKENDFKIMNIEPSDFGSKEVLWCDSKSIRLKKRQTEREARYMLTVIDFSKYKTKLYVLDKELFLEILRE